MCTQQHNYMTFDTVTYHDDIPYEHDRTFLLDDSAQVAADSTVALYNGGIRAYEHVKVAVLHDYNSNPGNFWWMGSIRTTLIQRLFQQLCSSLFPQSNKCHCFFSNSISKYVIPNSCLKILHPLLRSGFCFSP